MSIFVYADESGVFDPAHNDTFVFGGLLFLDKDTRDLAKRRYISAERALHDAGVCCNQEMKATRLSNKQKAGMFRSMNPYHRFGVVVEQARVLSQITQDKKSKQRYLDYVFKRGLKAKFEQLIHVGALRAADVDDIYVFMDEHTTATNGRYELCESLQNEFKRGTYNSDWDHFFPPLFPGMRRVEFNMKDSCQDPLIRAADITANRLYFSVVNNQPQMASSIYYITLPD